MAAGDGAAEQARFVGEALVAEKLHALELSGWRILHDVHWPGRPTANLDHVLVGSGGVLVVDAKNWRGEVRLRDGLLRQNGYSREQEASGVLQQCAAVAALLEPQHRRLVQGWVCLVGQPELRGTTKSGIRVEGLDTLLPAVAGLPAVLDPALVPTIHGRLQQLLGGGTSPGLLTTAQFEPADAPAASLRQWGTRPSLRPLRPLRPVPEAASPRRPPGPVRTARPVPTAGPARGGRSAAGRSSRAASVRSSGWAFCLSLRRS